MPKPDWWRNFLTRAEVIAAGVPEKLLRSLIVAGEIRTKRIEPEMRLGYARVDVERYRAGIERAIEAGRRDARGK